MLVRMRTKLALLCLLPASSVFAEAAEHQRLYRSPYYLGRGDTGIATAEDHEAIFYNPAGIALGKGVYKRTVLLSPHADYSLATRDLYRKLALEKTESTTALKEAVGRNQHLGIGNLTALVMRRAALGIVTTTNIDLLVTKSKDNNALETLQTRASMNQGLTFSLAESFWDQSLMVGFTGKYLVARGDGAIDVSVIDAQDVSKLQDDENFLKVGSGAGGDFGLMLRSKTGMEPAFGLQIENVGGTVLIPQVEGAEGQVLEQTVNLGLSVKPGTKFSKVQLHFDYRDITNTHGTNPFKKAHIGTEISLKQMIGFTAGLHQGYPTGGLYLNLYFVRFDLGFYTQEMGERAGDRPDTRFFFRLLGGF